MGKRAALFPGQGAQKVGMGRAVCERHPAAREIFDRANAALGFDIAAICMDGPAEKLKETEIQQPAVFTTTMACVEAWCAEDVESQPIDAAAGLSLGEYAALTYAGALDFDDAVRLVRKRGRFMHEAAVQNPGAMATVLGMTAEELEPLAREAAAKGTLVLANYNSPRQVVASGVVDAVDELCRLAKDAGAKRCIKLNVSGAFHSPLMQPASDKLAAELEQIEIRTPRIPVVANVDAEPVTDPAEIRRKLVEQLTSPVFWEQSMRRLLAEGFDRFVEIGPGKVLAGLMRRIERSARVENYEA